MRGFENTCSQQNRVMSTSTFLSPLERKRELYEYMLKGFVDWFCDKKSLALQEFNYQNDLSKLKLVKLTFFCSAIRFDGEDLLEIFDKFYALPFGPVESELLDFHNKENIVRFKVDSARMVINSELLDRSSIDRSFLNLDFDEADKIDRAVNKLKTVNPELITYSAKRLVDISHSWSSWRYEFEAAKQQGKLSSPIPVDRIRADTPYFF